MPAQQGRRGDKEDPPPLTAEQSGQSAQHGAISGRVPGPRHLTVQHRQLVPEHGDLDVLLVGCRAEPEEVQEPANEQERDRASHVDNRGRCAEPLLRPRILLLAPFRRTEAEPHRWRASTSKWRSAPAGSPAFGASLRESEQGSPVTRPKTSSKRLHSDVRRRSPVTAYRALGNALLLSWTREVPIWRGQTVAPPAIMLARLVCRAFNIRRPPGRLRPFNPAGPALAEASKAGSLSTHSQRNDGSSRLRSTRTAGVSDARLSSVQRATSGSAPGRPRPQRSPLCGSRRWWWRSRQLSGSAARARPPRGPLN